MAINENKGLIQNIISKETGMESQQNEQREEAAVSKQRSAADSLGR